MTMAMFLARAFADVAADADVDLSPMLERWRQVAELMDQAGNADQN
jgi:hypothetical protein